MKHAGLRSIASNSIKLAGARLLNPLVRLIYVLILARFLGPEIYGLLAYGQSWYNAFLPLTTLGVAAVLSREVGRNRERGTEVVARALALRIVVSVFVAGICAVTAWFVESDSSTRSLLLIFSLALIGRALSVTAENIFVAYERSQFAFYQEAIFRPLEVGAGLIILLLGGGMFEIAAMHTIVWWLQAARAHFLVRSRIVSVAPDWNLRSMGNLILEGLPIGLGVIMAAWIFQGPLVLYRQTGAADADLGTFALAYQGLVLALVIPISIGAVALPVLSRAVERADGKDTLFVSVMARLAFLSGATAGLAGMVVGPDLIPFVFGRKFEMTGQLLGPMLWLLIPATIATIGGQVVAARKKYFQYFITAAAGAAALTVCLPFAVSAFAVYGILVAGGIGLTVWSISLLFAVSSAKTFRWSVVLFRPALVALAALALYLGLKPESPWLALTAALGLLACGGWFVVLTKEERVSLMAFVSHNLPASWRR